jgi:hypothetical protein
MAWLESNKNNNGKCKELTGTLNKRRKQESVLDLLNTMMITDYKTRKI